MYADLAEKVDIVKVAEPVCVVYEYRLAVGNVDKARHLTLKALDVVRNGLLCHHAAHIALARRVAYHSGTAAENSNGAVSGALHTRHDKHLHHVTDVKAVRSGVKSDIKGRAALLEQLRYRLLVGALCKQSSRLKILNYVHLSSPISDSVLFILRIGGIRRTER